MIELRRVPWPLWIYSAVVLLGVVLIEIKTHGPTPAKALYVCIMLAWLYFLLKGVRWVWIGTVGIYALGLISYLISGSLKWQAIALSVVGLLLLLLPATRRYFSRSAAVARL